MKSLAFHVKCSVNCTWLRHRRRTAATRHNRPAGIRLPARNTAPKMVFSKPSAAAAARVANVILSFQRLNPRVPNPGTNDMEAL